MMIILTYFIWLSAPLFFLQQQEGIISFFYFSHTSMSDICFWVVWNQGLKENTEGMVSVKNLLIHIFYFQFLDCMLQT